VGTGANKSIFYSQNYSSCGKMGVHAPTNFVYTQIELCMLYVYIPMAGGWE
jgi:hypothetical protein